MGQRAKITQLPGDVREWLDRALSANGFAQYEQLEGELKARGYSIGKSSIHRYGSNLERRLAAIKSSTEAAKLIAAEAPDDADQRSGAVISMLQTDIFEMLVGLRELDEEDDPVKRAKVLSSLAGNIAKLSRASVHQKRHEIEIRAKAQATADKVARLAKKGGLSGATVESIKREILGIAA